MSELTPDGKGPYLFDSGISKLDFALLAANVQASTHLFGLCCGGYSSAWGMAGELARSKTAPTLSSLGDFGI